MSNLNSIKKKLVIDFENRNAIVTSDSHSSKSSKADIKAKVDQAKIYAQNEIDEFKSIIQDAKTRMEKLVLFKEEAPALEMIFETTILKEIVEPIVKGSKPYGMPDEVFKNARKNMFYELIKTYVDKEK